MSPCFPGLRYVSQIPTHITAITGLLCFHSISGISHSPSSLGCSVPRHYPIPALLIHRCSLLSSFARILDFSHVRIILPSMGVSFLPGLLPSDTPDVLIAAPGFPATARLQGLALWLVLFPAQEHTHTHLRMYSPILLCPLFVPYILMSGSPHCCVAFPRILHTLPPHLLTEDTTPSHNQRVIHTPSATLLMSKFFLSVLHSCAQITMHSLQVAGLLLGLMLGYRLDTPPSFAHSHSRTYLALVPSPPYSSP